MFSSLLVFFPIAENHKLLICFKFPPKIVIEPKLHIPLISCVFIPLLIGMCQGQKIPTRTNASHSHRTSAEEGTITKKLGKEILRS